MEESTPCIYLKKRIVKIQAHTEVLVLLLACIVSLDESINKEIKTEKECGCVAER